MGTWLGDLRRTWRRLWQQPTAAVVALATLAVAIGASSAMFSIFSALLLRQLPFAAPAQLVWLSPASLRSGQPQPATAGFSQPDFLDYRRNSPDLSLAAYYVNSATLVDSGLPPRHVSWAGVTAGFFTVLGVEPVLGRDFSTGDEQPPEPQVAVLSDALWRQRYHADPSVLGRTMDVDNASFTIVGVMPPGFAYPQKVDFWADLTFNSATIQPRSFRYLQVFGRLASAATPAQAQLHLNSVAERLARTYPLTNADQGVLAIPLSLQVTGAYRTTLWMMLLAAILVLAIACANIANLLLAGSAGRWREMALRAALGARRRRLLTQLMLEALMLAALGAGLGWLLAWLALPLLRRSQAPGLPSLASVALDHRVFLYALTATVLTALWFGLAPAWELLWPRPGRSLHRASSDSGFGRRRFLAAVAAAEVAAAVVLLVVAGILLQNLRRVLRVSPGFDPNQVVTCRVSLLFASVDELHRNQIYLQQLNDRVAALPGVEASGMISELPLGEPHLLLHFIPPGDSRGAAIPVSARPQAGLGRVLPGYFRALAIPVRGRPFTDVDTAQSERVVIVSQSFARHFYPDGDALGHALQWGTRQLITARIVGVAGDVPGVNLNDPPAWVIYEPFPQSPTGDMSLVVRARGDPLALLPQLRATMTAVNSQMPLYDVQTMSARLAQAQAPDRFRADLLLAMALLAVLLALAGVYGVLAHGVAQRQREIGVRMALGASPRQVRGLVLGHSLRLLVAGSLAGVLLGAWASVALRHASAFVSGRSLLPFVAAPVLLIAAGLLASYLPARHATRVDPVRTLRE